MDRFVTMTTKSALTTQWVLWESTLCHKRHIKAYWNDLSQHCVKKTIRRVMSINYTYYGFTLLIVLNVRLSWNDYQIFFELQALQSDISQTI